MGLKEIHDVIYIHRLKDIGMTKTDEKNLRTMLAQHTSTPTAAANCSFYRIKDRPGFYGLKAEAMLPKAPNNDFCVASESTASLKRKIKDQDSSGVQAKRKLTAKTSADIMRRSNSFTGNAMTKARLLTQRRTSSPNVVPSFTNLRNRPHSQYFQSRSTALLQKSLSSPIITNRKMQLDLETPSSVLTNTRLKSVISSATFAMLPSSYQYKLIQLLPEVDRKLDANEVPRMSRTALNNEFFSQAIQDWATHLSDGEFTRETQARILQEISRERSKINPWKEQFFEEYYGQRKELKRTRSRSHDVGNQLSDLSFEAQLGKFRDLSEKMNTDTIATGESDARNVVSGSESDQEPNFVRAEKGNPPSQEKDFAKSLNKRKISKPFKRTIYNSSIAYPTNTATIHRRGVPTASNIFPHFTSNALSKFQVRDEAYRSDSEESNAELSDSNSFHQHDATDDEGESSDDLMNAGDDNLLDVDGDNSDSCDDDRPTVEIASKQSSVTTELKQMSNNDLVSLDKTVKSVEKPKNAVDDATPPTNPQRIVDDTTRVSIGGNVKSTPEPQSTTTPSYGDSIIPRISTVSALLSSPLPPTTICTSVKASRTIEEKVLPQRQIVSSREHKCDGSERLKPGKPSNPGSYRTPDSNKTAVKLKKDKSRDDNIPSHPKSVHGQSAIIGHMTSQARNVMPHFQIPISNIHNVTSKKADTPSQPSTVVKSFSGHAGVTRPPAPLNASPAKRTKTLAEIKAQMKAKKLAVATASFGSSGQKENLVTTPPSLQNPMKVAQPGFSSNKESLGTTSTKKTFQNQTSSDMKTDKIISSSEKIVVKAEPLPIGPRLEVGPNSDISECSAVKNPTETRDDSLCTSKEKIILKIKGGVVENCSSTQENLPSSTPSNVKSSDDDEEDVIGKKRHLSHVIMSSGESSDDFDRLPNSVSNIEKVNDNYSMLTQLAMPSAFSAKFNSDSVLRRTTKSPVFGEQPFDVVTVTSKSPHVAIPDKRLGDMIQPFMTGRPVIGFQDIPSCCTLSSSVNTTFTQSATTLVASPESRKYRSTSKGKSLVKMQQLARCDRNHSDESDPIDSGTDEDFTDSSADENKLISAPDIRRSMLRKRDPATGRVERIQSSNLNYDHIEENSQMKKEQRRWSDCDDSYYSSSSEDKPAVITECICACKRLVLCKGCGAYTHEECLSAAKLCSLCCVL